MASELYWSEMPHDPVVLRAAIDALKAAGIPESPLAVSIAGIPVTNATTAKKIADSVSFITNISIAAGLVDGGYTDPTEMKAIADALVDIKADQVAQVMASLGITDRALANQLQTIVSKIDDVWDAADIISNGEGDLIKTQNLANKYAPASGTIPTVVANTSSGSTGSSSSGSGTSSSSGSTAPANISLIETCTSCSPVTF